jgi:hypothetical protein
MVKRLLSVLYGERGQTLTSYDQLFKNLIESFFSDFLRLVLPSLVPRLLEGARFLDKQSFTDWPKGSRREMDLLAEMDLLDGEVCVLIHVEIEAKARRGMKERIWDYYMQLRLRHRLLVVPILLNLKGGRPGISVETLTEGLADLETVRFRHSVFGLSGCLAEDYLAKPEPLAWGLAALMRPGRWSRARQKIECLRRIAEAPELSGLGRFLLVNCVETHLELKGKAVAEYAALRQASGNQGVETMKTTWADRMREEGVELGIRQGVKQGVDALKQVLLSQLSQRFGPLPESVRKRVQSINSMEPLTRIAEEILVARSLDEVKI